MDEEGIRIDIAEALGKANAAICIQGAVITMLVTKGILAKEDVATIAGIAAQGLSEMEGVTPDTKVMSESALRGFAKTWTRYLNKH